MSIIFYSRHKSRWIFRYTIIMRCFTPKCAESYRTLTVEGRKYIVTTVFRENGPETFGDILLKLIQADALPDH